MQHIPIRKLYWDSFEMVLNQAVEILAKDISLVLGEPVAPLLRAIKDRKVSTYLYEEQETLTVDISEMRCKHFVPSLETPTILIPCSNPIVWSSTPGTNQNVCVEHTHMNLLSMNLSEWRYVSFGGDTMLTDGSYVYTKDMNLVGRYCPTTNIITEFECND